MTSGPDTDQQPDSSRPSPTRGSGRSRRKGTPVAAGTAVPQVVLSMEFPPDAAKLGCPKPYFDPYNRVLEFAVAMAHARKRGNRSDVMHRRAIAWLCAVLVLASGLAGCGRPAPGAARVPAPKQPAQRQLGPIGKARPVAAPDRNETPSPGRIVSEDASPD